MGARRNRATAVLVAGAAGLLVAGFGPAPPTAVWEERVPLTDAIDIAGPRSDGRYVVTADGLLHLFDPARESLRAFARGARGYSSDTGEPYIALPPAGGHRVGGCSYGRDAVYAIETGDAAGVVRIGRGGKARQFVDFGGGFPSGVAFDDRGRFGHRLLVVVQDAANQPGRLVAIDCRGRVETVVADAPRIEGGVAIAPRSFGPFGGDLIAADEHSGTIYALGPRGGVRTVAAGLPAGLDIGVESVGFAPRLRPGVAAFNADPGSDSLLRLGRGALREVGLRRGELLASAEGSGTPTFAVRCDPRCESRQVATGPADGHAEGHLVFVRARRSGRG